MKAQEDHRHPWYNVRVAIHCPACKAAFINRKNQRCRQCGVILVSPGESFVRQENERAFVWSVDEWSPVIYGTGKQFVNIPVVVEPSQRESR